MTSIDRSAEYRSFAEQHAAAFGQATMAKISAALAEHNAAVVAFACEMQARIDHANAMLRHIDEASKHRLPMGDFVHVLLTPTKAAQLRDYVRALDEGRQDGDRSN